MALQTGLDERRRRAAYRATHRGTKEMDWLLGRYAEARLATMPEAELDEFERLIEQQDPYLQQQIMLNTEPSDREFGPLIERIRAYHGISRDNSPATSRA